MRLVVVVGTRPEIIKMAPVIRAADQRGAQCAVVHTGQHYSFELDAIFFDELQLRKPDVNLGVGSGSHPYQIATVVSRLESVLREVNPDVVLVEGDTNSVLAAGLTANKLGLRMGHVEAGLRSQDRRMPEEINRILVDHAADDLFAPTATAVANLRREGIPSERMHLTGNTIVDEVLRQRARARERCTRDRFGLSSRTYALATVHRAENVEDVARLTAIASGLGKTARVLDIPILLALHPRTSRRLNELGILLDPAIRQLPPLGYLDFLSLEDTAAVVLTDSGGAQEEACTLGVPCVTMRDNTERPETIDVGANVLAGADADAIVEAASLMVQADRSWPNPFGDGQSGQRIISALLGQPLPDRLVALPIGDASSTGSTVPEPADISRSGSGGD